MNKLNVQFSINDEIYYKLNNIYNNEYVECIIISKENNIMIYYKIYNIINNIQFKWMKIIKTFEM